MRSRIRNAEKLSTGLNVIRQTISDWSSEADIGITVRNVDASQIELRRVKRFTISMRTLGDGRGVEDSTFTLGRIVNNRIGLDIWCATAIAWNTPLRWSPAPRLIETPCKRTVSAGGVCHDDRWDGAAGRRGAPARGWRSGARA
ncbi:MAG TPA: hypothetical protein VGN83_19155, partial [Falsiroseomonas sp.]|nr:hypothetical protein [Falsiroseomonas sp.]